MQLLLCSATEHEIIPFLESGNHQNNVEILITGVGLMAATYAITKKVYENRPQFIIQAGLAGSLDHSLALTKVVLVENETVGDLGVEEQNQFISISELNLQNKNDFPWQENKLHNKLDAFTYSELPRVNAVSVNEISTNPSRIKYYRDVIGAHIETMEGAALHFVALQQNIPFLQVRSLSNYIAERNKTKWKIREAIDHLNAELINLISNI